MRNQTIVRALLPAACALAMAGVPALAEDHDEDELQFDVTEIFFELNNTDGDLGIHALIDGEPWKRLQMFDPRERRMLNVRVTGRLRRQGLTEFFFESAEPTFDDLTPQAFFARFPEGEYEVEGITTDGLDIEGETIVTHTMPAPAEPTVNGQPLVAICDDEDPDFVELESVGGPPVTISWPAVTMSHPDADGPGAGVQPPIAVEIVNYQVVIEAETESGFESVLSVVLSPDDTSLTIPVEVLALADEFKYEVLAREASYNQTAVESCFAL